MLNRAVGGINPLAVEIAAREGARTVWMPTVDAVNEAGEREDVKPGAKVPGLGQAPTRPARAGAGDRAGAGASTSAARCSPETRAVLELIARHELLLATGHISRDEIFAVVDAALELGVRQIVITHPEFPAQSLTVEDQRALAERGALLERCFTTPHTGKISWEQLAREHPRRAAPSTRSCRPISDRCSTRPSRTVWR